MTTEEKIARRKLSLLDLSEELRNVRKACRVMGYSAQQFYGIRRANQTDEASGLLDKVPGDKGAPPNRLAPEIEQNILDYSLQHPTHGPLRVAHELALRGVTVSSGGVRAVWSRHDLLSKHDPLLRLEREQRDPTLTQREEQEQLLERLSPEFRECKIEVHHTGELLAIDTFLVGGLKGIGQVYLQTVLDCFSRYGFGRLYTSKLPLTAVHVLNNDVLPFFEERCVRIETVLSDNGREYCGRPDQHPFELFLQLEGIEHRTTGVRSTQSMGFVERFHHTLLEEHFDNAGRTSLYESVEQMQGVLDTYLRHYNHERPQPGRMMEGRTPAQMFTAGIIERPDIPLPESNNTGSGAGVR